MNDHCNNCSTLFHRAKCLDLLEGPFRVNSELPEKDYSSKVLFLDYDFYFFYLYCSIMCEILFISFCISAFEDMRKMKDDLEIDESSDDSVVKAKRFFEVCFSYLLPFVLLLIYVFLMLVFLLLKIAVSRNFTRGRRRELVHAACLYCACRYEIIYFCLCLP